MGSLLVVNHRVALAGSGERAGVLSHTVGYIATREGCVLEPTPDDDLRRTRGMLGYMADRPGAVQHDGSGLFGPDGAVNVSAARAGIEQAGGAVVTSVVSVRRADGEEIGLSTRQDYERYLRAHWAPAMADAMGIPEERVRWVAAFHLNSDASYHAHVVTYDAAGKFDRVLDRKRMERARESLTEAAAGPALRRLARERTAARDECVRIARGMDARELERGVKLPAEGSLKYEWLRRNHPGVAKAIEAAVASEAERNEALKRAAAEHRRLVERAAHLKGVEGARRNQYISDAEADLRTRMCNAAITAMRPDRSARRSRAIHDPDAPRPSDERRRVRQVRDELSALGARDRARVAEVVDARKPLPEDALSKCRSWRAATSAVQVGSPRTLRVAGRALGSASDAGHSGGDVADAAARLALDAAARAIVRSISLASPVAGRAAGIAVGAVRTLGRAI